MLLIKNGKIFPVTYPIISKGDILIHKKKIKKIDENIQCESVNKYIDATGKFIYPGLIDCHTHLGLDEAYKWYDKEELNEIGDPITPHLRAIDGFNPNDPGITEAMQNGITSVTATTGSIQILSGQAAAVKLIPNGARQDFLIKPCIGIKGGLGENPKKYYKSINMMPTNRMASAFLLRQSLYDAVAYINGWKPNETSTTLWNRLEKLKALLPVIQRKIPLRIHAHRHYDILTAIRIAQEFKIKLVIEHATESFLILKEIKRLKIPLVLGPNGFTVSEKNESGFETFSHIKHLQNKNILFAFGSDHPVIATAYLPRMLSKLTHYGINESSLLQSLTINAARIMGCEKLIGSIEPDKDADLVITNGPIFNPRTKVEYVFINGEIVFQR